MKQMTIASRAGIKAGIWYQSRMIATLRLAQCGDGTFYYQPNRDNAGYDSSARMTASSVVAFIFTIPKGNLVTTGKASP